jgi:protein involved in polysaccharide export with SLBB domain
MFFKTKDFNLKGGAASFLLRIYPYARRIGGLKMKISPIMSRCINAHSGFLLAVLLIIGCSSPASNIPELTPERLVAKPASQAPLEKTYKLVPYDQINVRFTYHPESDPKAPVSIRPDGQIMLDNVGSIRAAGLTPEELGKEIAAKSSKRLRDPEVIVTVSQFTPRKIYVGGQVKTPGIVQFQGDMTPLQAIFDRGGFTPEAQIDSVILIRDTGAPEPVIGRINAMQSLEGGVPERISLLTNDVIYVPMSGISTTNQWVKQHLREIMPIELLGLGYLFGS